MGKRIRFSREEVGWLGRNNKDINGTMSEEEVPKELEEFVEKILEVIDYPLIWLYRQEFCFKNYSEEECKEFSNKLGIEIHPDSDLIYIAKKLGNLL